MEINESNRKVLDEFNKIRSEKKEKINHPSQNGGSYLNTIKNKIVRGMRNKRKKDKVNSKSDYDLEDEHLESVKKEFLIAGPLEASSDSDGSFEKLKNYFEKLYEKQEN